MNLTWTEAEMKRARRKWSAYDIVLAHERRQRRRAAWSIMATILLTLALLTGAPQLALVILLMMPVMAWLIWLVL